MTNKGKIPRVIRPIEEGTTITSKKSYVPLYLKLIAIGLLFIMSIVMINKNYIEHDSTIYENFESYREAYEDEPIDLIGTIDKLTKATETEVFGKINFKNINFQEDIIAGEWAILDGLRDWLNSALSGIVSVTKTITSIAITPIKAIIVIFNTITSIGA